MNRLLFIIFPILLTSCYTSKKITSGIYKKKGTDFIYSLELNSVNNTFLLTKKYFEVNSSCAGKWVQKSDTLFLKCNEEKDIGIVLSSGYMNEREYAIKIINKKKLKLHNILLKRF